MTKFQEFVTVELCRARSMHGRVNSLHEGYAVLLEEVEEFWEEVRKKSSERNRLLMLDELIQVGAMAQKIAEDMGLVE